jgi:hypothetical protein
LLPLLSECFERLTMLIADLPSFLCQSPELFRFLPGRLRCGALVFRGRAVLLGALTAVFSLFAPVLRPLALLFCRDVILQHRNSILSNRALDGSIHPILSFHGNSDVFGRAQTTLSVPR